MRQPLLPALTAIACCAPGAMAAPVGIDTSSALNGITDVYSVTFDGPVIPCGAGSPPYCSFFNGFAPPAPPATRALVIVPNPTGVTSAVPLGFAQAPASGSFLDLTLGAGNSTLTLAGGTIAFQNFAITILGETVISVSGAGMVFDAASQAVAVNGDGQAEFLVNLAPAVAADFSSFSQVVTSCSGSYCALVSVLTLDMVRYRLFVDYDPTFTTFTGSFIGQTGNNSLVFATLNSVPLPATGWLIAPAFGFAGAFLRRRR